MSAAALSSLSVQSILTRQMEVIADNLANMTTAGFKSEILAVRTERVGTGLNSTSFAVSPGLARDMSEGKFAQTGNPLDLAIQGKGFFVIQTPQGERYTRNGRFTLDTEGQLVNTGGQPVLSVNGRPISVPNGAAKITISVDGTLTADGNAIGTIGIVDFENSHNLRRISGSLYSADQPPKPAENARVIQGALEESNVQAVHQITKMMEVMRRFQSAQRIADSENERVRRAIQVLTKAA